MTSRAAFSTVDGSWSKAHAGSSMTWDTPMASYSFNARHALVHRTHHGVDAGVDVGNGVGVAFFEGGAGLGLGLFAGLGEVDVQVDGVGEFPVLPTPLPAVSVYLAIHLGGFCGVGVGGEEAVAPPARPSEDGRGVAAEPDGGMGPLVGSGAEGVVGELENWPSKE